MKKFGVPALVLIGLVFAAGAWYLVQSPQGTREPPASAQEPPASSPQVFGPPGPPPASSGPRVSYTNASEDMIVVTAPQPGMVRGPNVQVSGKARGNWYFEASFPLEVRSAQGETLVQIPVQAQGEWMTTEFVPFDVSVALPAGYRGPAAIILHNDNPSGLPENDRSVSIPVIIQ